jgi:hypothetical protein
MKKKILIGLAAVAVATIAAVNITIYSQNSDLSALSLANVEALAQESGRGWCYGGCRDIGWGYNRVLMCSCSYTGYFSECDLWECY